MKSRKKYFSIGLAASFSMVLAVIVISACTEKAKAKAKPNFVYKDPRNDGVIAKMGGVDITKEEVIGNDKADKIALDKAEYEFWDNHLKALVSKRILEGEAKNANMSLDDYVNKKIASNVKISDSEYKKFVSDKKIPEGQITPQIKTRIMEYLQAQKKQEQIDTHVAKATAGKPIEVYLKKPKLDMKVEVGAAPVYGKGGAPVTIVEFSDFQCPFCSKGADIVNQLKKKYGGKVQIAFKQFPLPMHQQARGAAEASLCVNEQNTDKFWKFHDLAFKNQDKLDKDNLEKFAKEVGADTKKYNECVTAKKFADVVQKDMEYGEKIGVKSTPTFFVNGQMISGAVPVEEFSEIIDEELETKKD